MNCLLLIARPSLDQSCGELTTLALKVFAQLGFEQLDVYGSSLLEHTIGSYHCYAIATYSRLCNWYLNSVHRCL
jgi:hypothetical protein